MLEKIRFSGIFKDEDQLMRTPLEKSSIIFNEPNNINDALKEGFFFMLPIFFATLIPLVMSISDLLIHFQCEVSDLIFSFVLSGILLLFLTFVHEIIHALCYPKEARTEIYISKDFMSLFVYSTDIVSKARFMIICIAPNVVLGFIPFWVGMLLRHSLFPRIAMILMIVGFASIVMGMGDYYNMFNAYQQVPSDGFVFNSGLHSYWYRKGANETPKANNSKKILLILLCSLSFILLSFGSEICLLLFFVVAGLSSFEAERFYSFFKWFNVASIVFAYFVLLNFI